MRWNWQQDDWPNFKYDRSRLEALERRFLLSAGQCFGVFKHLTDDDRQYLLVELISNEALKTSAIEGEYLNRDSLQSSICRQFGLITDQRKIPAAEQGIANVMVNLYQHFAEPLTQQLLCDWHSALLAGRQDLHDIGCYRSQAEPMQIVSGPIYAPKIHFQAPPATIIAAEMQQFIDWFNNSLSSEKNHETQALAALQRAGIAHLYFESIHPFEDGNGRLGRAIAEKALAQSLGQPSLIALASTIESQRNRYYAALEQANKQNHIDDWLDYFANLVLDAQASTHAWIDFLIQKSRLYDRVRGQLNVRQEKALARLFREGPNGFVGGLSAEKYHGITGAPAATVTRDLQDLVAKGVLRRTGERKTTRYHLLLDKKGGH